MQQHLGKLFVTFIVIMIALCVCFVNIKAAVLSMAILSLVMFITIMVTNIGNAFLNKDADMNYGIGWQILFTFLIAFCFGIYFNI